MSLIYLAWRNLFRNLRRTWMCCLTVAFGSAGLLIFQGFNTGLMNQYRENTIRVKYGHGQIFPKGYRDQVHEQPWELWIENVETIEPRIKELKGVVETFPRISFYSFLTKGATNLAAHGEGVVPEREKKFFTHLNFEEGSDLSSDDEIIIGKGLAKSLGVRVGDSLTAMGNTTHGQLNGMDLRVAGIFHTGVQTFDNSYFRISLKAAQSFLDTDRVEHIALQTEGVEVWPQVEKQIQNLFPSLQAIPFDELDAVYYKNSVQFLEAQFGLIRIILLIIVALGIFNMIVVTLLERAAEVGALRANGESRTRLWGIFLSENFLLGLFGGALGIVISLVFTETFLRNGIEMPPGPGITRNFHIILEFMPVHFVQALALPLFTTVAASIFPIRKLLKKSIPDLLRS